MGKSVSEISHKFHKIFMTEFGISLNIEMLENFNVKQNKSRIGKSGAVYRKNVEFSQKIFFNN